MLEGEQSSKKLADLGRGRLREKIPQMELALEGRMTAHHRWMLRLQREQLESLERQIAKLDICIQDHICAYQQAVDLDPDNLDAKRALAQALLNNNQLEDAEHAYQEIASADPQDAQALARIAECQRREGHYEQALATLKKAQALSTDSDEILFNESLTYDALGRYPESTQILNGLVSRSSKGDNHYNDGDEWHKGGSGAKNH